MRIMLITLNWKRCHQKITANVLRLAAGGQIEFLLPGTVAKFIIESSLFSLFYRSIEFRQPRTAAQ